MANMLLLAFKKTLLNAPYTESELLQPYQAIECKWAQEDSVRFTTDSLRGEPIELVAQIKMYQDYWKKASEED